VTPTTLASLAALGAAFTWGLGSMLFARSLAAAPPSVLGGREPLAPSGANLFKNLLALLLFALYALVTGVELPGAAAWPRLLVSGALGFALGDMLYFAALPRIGVQKSAMIGELNVPFTAGLSFAFLGERFSAVFLVAAALFQSLGALVGHSGMEGVSVLGGTLVRMAGGTAAAFVVAPVAGAWSGSGAASELARLVRPFHDRATWRPLAVAALFGAVLGLPLFHYALRELDPGRAMVLFATTPLFTLPLSRVFGERHGARAWLGTIVGFTGVAWIIALLHG
jgi:drug/metabolite transporter (DMT)-like permease